MLSVREEILKECGAVPAILYGHIESKWSGEIMLYPQKDVEEELGLESQVQRRGLKKLEEKGYISIKKNGLYHKRYVIINQKIIK